MDTQETRLFLTDHTDGPHVTLMLGDDRIEHVMTYEQAGRFAQMLIAVIIRNHPTGRWEVS